MCSQVLCLKATMIIGYGTGIGVGTGANIGDTNGSGSHLVCFWSHLEPGPWFCHGSDPFATLGRCLWLWLGSYMYLQGKRLREPPLMISLPYMLREGGREGPWVGFVQSDFLIQWPALMISLLHMPIFLTLLFLVYLAIYHMRMMDQVQVVLVLLGKGQEGCRSMKIPEWMNDVVVAINKTVQTRMNDLPIGKKSLNIFFFFLQIFHSEIKSSCYPDILLWRKISSYAYVLLQMYYVFFLNGTMYYVCRHICPYNAFCICLNRFNFFLSSLSGSWFRSFYLSIWFNLVGKQTLF